MDTFAMTMNLELLVLQLDHHLYRLFEEQAEGVEGDEISPGCGGQELQLWRSLDGEVNRQPIENRNKEIGKVHRRRCNLPDAFVPLKDAPELGSSRGYWIIKTVQEDPEATAI